MRMAKVKTKLIVDVILASLIVQKAPALLRMIIPIDPTIEKIAGAGAGYLTGVMFKRPDISNASLALAVADFANPLIDSVISGGVALPMQMGVKTIKPMPTKYIKETHQSVSDYMHLNDYIDNPSNRQSFDSYRDSY